MIPTEVVKFVNEGSMRDLGRIFMMIGDRLSSVSDLEEELERERIPGGLKNDE